MRHEPDEVAGRGLLTGSSGGRGLFSSQIFARSAYAAPAYQQQPSGRGLLNAPRASARPQAYAQRPLQAPYVLQYGAPQPAPPQYAPPPYGAGGTLRGGARQLCRGLVLQPPYTLDAGDKLRVVVFGQDGISNTYIVDAGGNVSLPLIGPVPARGITTQQLSQRIAERLRQGYVREPHVSVEVGDLPAVLHPRRGDHAGAVSLRRRHDGGEGDRDRRRLCPARLQEDGRTHPQRVGPPMKGEVPLSYPLRPGDTVLVKERWF